MAGKKKPAKRKPGPIDYSKPGEPGNTPPAPPEIPTTTGQPGGQPVGGPGLVGAGLGHSGPVVVRVPPDLLSKAAAEAINFNLPAEKKKNLHQLMALLTGAEIASGNIGRKARIGLIIGGAFALALPTILSAFRNLRIERKREVNDLGQDREDVLGADSVDRSGPDRGSTEGPSSANMAGHVARFR